jgi:integrase
MGFLAELRNKGKSTTTANYYLTAVKGFTRWLWKDRRTGTDPLAGLSRLANAAADIRHARRDLTPDELHWLLETTHGNDRAFRGLSGRDRFTLYATAAGTGFRVSELASLTPSSFDLDAAPPVVCVEAAYSKNRKEAIQPIATDLARVLRDYLNGKPADSSVWPGTWTEKAAKMLRSDLQAGRSAWLETFQPKAQREQMAQSDFLIYRDGSDRVIDFHAFRHTYISRLIQSGASPKTAQTLARHSTVTLTLGRYAHAGLFDLTAAVEALPSIIPMDRPRQGFALAATGTDSLTREAKKNLGPNLGPQPAISIDSERQTETETVNSQDSENPNKHADSSVISGVLLNGPNRIRTCNQGIMSPLLCR